MTDPLDWPIVVTDRCADACADAFGFGDRERARDWLTDAIADRGEVTETLPGPVRGRRSPSGYFLLVPGSFVLPLAPYRRAPEHWAATNCVPFPRSRSREDPLTLRGNALLSLVHFLPHAVERFQERAGADPDPAVALAQLLDRISPTVRATRRSPSWSGTRDADFYLVAGPGDEYCLPCRVGAHETRPYDVITCIIRDDSRTGGVRKGS
ncbi:hypothetical protein [Actinokineospora spheciospongiae]|uniref:hypothetical protein n=1 Tax=Actinokineospora spheciospongiae TaxID=909613 RepID=UPI000D71DA3B|nr:hypothetical protein [Actinokineospora spheciospongiae]PWW61859.1 hypothetical protein DFQ13_106106 [Actinokineospora spheciospongiae]